MKEKAFYLGFPALPGKDHLVEALVHDPPEVRWRIVRDLTRIEDRKDREELIEELRPCLSQTDDFRVNYRIKLALSVLQRPLGVEDYVLVKNKGAFKISELELYGNDLHRLAAEQSRPDLFPVVDFHIHPKAPDLKLLADLRDAEVSHAVILATDTDPSDVDRPEIKEKVRKDYSQSSISKWVPFEKVMEEIRASLYSPTHVTDRDVADWIKDYPDILVGFGSVNLCKSRDYIERKLEQIQRLKLRGIKLLPYAQFFNPSENENMDLLFEYCRQTGSIILSHSGCAAGLFEIPDFSGNSHPALWEPLVKKYPDVPLVLAHFGAYSADMPGIWLQDAMQLGKKYKNVYADLAAVNWLLESEEVLKEIRETIGFDRVLFATDYPVPLFSGITLSSVVRSLKGNVKLTEEERRKVLGGNAGSLLGIS